mgnify:CR=1 FL=1
MERFILGFCFFAILCSNILFSQTSSTTDAFIQNKHELILNMKSLNLSDFQSLVMDLNNLRNKIDTFVDASMKQCQQSQDKSQNIECFSHRKDSFKELWTQYYGLKEQYLKKLYEKFLEENSSQLKSALQNIDALQAPKSKRN